MTGIEQAFWEFEKWFWLLVMFGAGVIAVSYISSIISDIKRDRRIKKLIKEWEKGSENEG